MERREWPSPVGPSGKVKTVSRVPYGTDEDWDSSSSLRSDLDAYQQAAVMLRDATRDKRYRAYPMGQEAGAYLRWKRGQLTKASQHRYEATLRQLSLAFPDLELVDFEPPVGTDRIEEFLDERWGSLSPGTYNTALAVTRDFFKWAVLRGKLHGDPTLPIRRHKQGGVYRETISDSSCEGLIASQASRRDRLALRLLLYYGLRKGALRRIQFKHFDHVRKRLTIFTKGSKVRQVPIPEAAFWSDLGQYIIEWGASADDYFMAREHVVTHRKGLAAPRVDRYQTRDQPMGDNGLHNWWYRCLATAGLVPEGTTSGMKMHSARYTAGQRVLDKTKGNLKATQALLGHADIATTANVYVDWDDAALEQTLREVLGE
jgi:integrase